MNLSQLEKLGSELREIGHRRRELAEQIFNEVEVGHSHSSKELYKELSIISERAIELMTRQKKLFDEELQKMS